MIGFKEFSKENYDRLYSMMVEFYRSDAVDHPIDLDIIKRLLEDILTGDYTIRGYEVYYDDNLVGFGVMTRYYASEVAGITIQLEDLFIQEEYRSKGIAKEYFRRIKDKFPEAKRFRLEVARNNKRAIKLYKAGGFEELEYRQMIYDRV